MYALLLQQPDNSPTSQLADAAANGKKLQQATECFLCGYFLKISKHSVTCVFLFITYISFLRFVRE